MDIKLSVQESCGLMDFLIKNLKNMSRNNVKSLLKYKFVFVGNKAVSKFDHSLLPGQIVTVKGKDYQPNQPANSLNFIFEDDDIIVINKPAGLLSIATDNERDATAYSYLTEYVKQKNPANRIYIVHRLDRDTSGVFMVAKNEQMKLALQNNWDNLITQRQYVAVVEGRLKEKEGTITSWLRETVTHMIYSSYTKDDGLLAITHYKVINENSDYSLLSINIDTGRKNQIRVHMRDIQHCVVGDKKYGILKSPNPIHRLGLHANKLAFTHPISNKEVCFEAKTPRLFTGLFNLK